MVLTLTSLYTNWYWRKDIGGDTALHYIQIDSELLAARRHTVYEHWLNTDCNKSLKQAVFFNVFND